MTAPRSTSASMRGRDGTRQAPRIPSRARRRIAVIALYAGYLALVCALWLARGAVGHAVIGGALALAALAVMVWGWVRTYQAGRPLGDDTDESLDERLLATRNAAYLSAYRILAFTVTLVGFYGTLAFDHSWWFPRTSDQWQVLAWGLFVIAITGPSALLSWRTPDLPTDDDDISSPAGAA